MRLLRVMLVCLAAVVVAQSARAQWGQSLKGRVVLDGNIPPRKPIDVGGKCVAPGGKVLDDELVVDEKTKGVRWAMVYLIDAGGDFKKPIPVKPGLVAALPKTVAVDQPCCQFEPHMVALHSSQSLTAKNSAKEPHNVFSPGANGAPALNQKLGPGESIEVRGWKAAMLPFTVNCTIHGWMNVRIGVFDHPYFAVTNERGTFEIKDPPAGKYRLVVWHEAVGWVAADPGKDPNKAGMTIEIHKDTVTETGDIKLKAP